MNVLYKVNKYTSCLVKGENGIKEEKPYKVYKPNWPGRGSAEDIDIEYLFVWMKENLKVR